VPQGPVRKPFTVAPTRTGPVKAGSDMSVKFIHDTGTDGSGPPPDPSTATASNDGVVLSTVNTYLLFSKDDGQNFTKVDPTTIFPQSDGGLCCDQVLLFNRRVNLFFWLLQYWGAPASPTGAPGSNRLRVAYASPADLKSNINSWNYFDLTQGGLDSGSNLDYPDIAFTDGFLYVSVGGWNSTSTIVGLIVARIPLSSITKDSGSSMGMESPWP
jgi:hypothetical protein